jgi:hypothetical protein
MGIRDGAVRHIRSISSAVRPYANRIGQPLFKLAALRFNAPNRPGVARELLAQPPQTSRRQPF